MDPDMILYLIRDRQNKIIAFPTEDEAMACEIPDMPHAGVEERPFGWLVRHHPRALVRIYSQYYWAEELA